MISQVSDLGPSWSSCLLLLLLLSFKKKKTGSDFKGEKKYNTTTIFPKTIMLLRKEFWKVTLCISEI
jgi:hypothetical protein